MCLITDHGIILLKDESIHEILRGCTPNEFVVHDVSTFVGHHVLVEVEGLHRLLQPTQVEQLDESPFRCPLTDLFHEHTANLRQCDDQYLLATIIHGLQHVKRND